LLVGAESGLLTDGFIGAVSNTLIQGIAFVPSKCFKIRDRLISDSAQQAKRRPAAIVFKRKLSGTFTLLLAVLQISFVKVLFFTFS
jgi:hypothetical protein